MDVEIIVDNDTKDECFNKFLTNVTKLDSSNKYFLDFNSLEMPINTLNLINITEDDIADQLKILNINKVVAIDGISPLFFIWT